MTRLRIANAPVSYGVFEATVGAVVGLPTPDELLTAIASAGYEGTELGPPGYLGDGAELARRLAGQGLELTGGFVPLRLSEPEHREEDLAELAHTLDLFTAAGATGARAVLADAGSQRRRGNLFRADTDRTLGLHQAAFQRLVEGVAEASALARARGFEPVFHHHAGTFVEAPWEIERLLEASDVGLLLDTGHAIVGGADPVELLCRHASRVRYVHVKDVRLDLVQEAHTQRVDMDDAWRRGIFCELGRGDVDLARFFEALEEVGYEGWVVVEQDRIPRPGEPLAEAADAQARNRRWLSEALGLERAHPLANGRRS